VHESKSVLVWALNTSLIAPPLVIWNQYCALYDFFLPAPCIVLQHAILYARRMGQPTQRATNYTARSNIDTAQIFLHANGQRPKRAMIRQRSQRRQRRGEPYTEHGLGVNTFHTHTAASMKRDRRKSLLFVVALSCKGQVVTPGKKNGFILFIFSLFWPG